MAGDLQTEFPEQRGWGRANLHYMRKLAERWPTEDTFVQHPAGQMPWTSVTTLLDGCADRATSALDSGSYAMTAANLTHRDPSADSDELVARCR
ncbi:MAG: hypothetical protein KDB26_10600 [Microthrixaceae bacterium]|nr:hypothetical protein [Microthrixaceae bacterium]